MRQLIFRVSCQNPAQDFTPRFDFLGYKLLCLNKFICSEGFRFQMNRNYGYFRGTAGFQ